MRFRSTPYRLRISLAALILCLSACSNSVDGGGAGDGKNGPSNLDIPEEGLTSPDDNPPYFPQRDQTGVVDVTLSGQVMHLYPHPRVWVTAESLAEVKAKAVTANPMWVGVKDYADKTLASGAYQNMADGGSLVAFAVGYLATGNTSYLNAAKKILLNYTNPSLYSIACDGTTYCGNDNIDYGSMELMYIAAGYDWIYWGLSDSERTTVRNWVYAQFIPFLRLHPYYGDPVHNLGHTKWAGEFLWSLATLNDDSRAQPLFESTYSFWKDDVLPLLDEVFPGGHTYSGSGYGYNRVFKYQLYAFEAAYSALDQKLYLQHNWPIDEAYYRVHATLPDTSFFLSDWESAEATFNQGRMNENEAILSNRYRGSPGGKLAQYWLDNVFKPRAYYNQGGTRVNPIYVGTWFLWYDPNFEEADYSQIYNPAYVADGLGVFMSRSKWNDPQASWVTMSASRYVGDHQLHNEGSLKIFREEYLMVENGRAYSGQSSNLTPTDTNILFMGDGKVDYDNITGGLYRREVGSTANFDRFWASSANGLSYARADLTSAYEPSYFPVDYFHRSLVHLNSLTGSSTDLVILFDRVKSRNAESKKLFFHVVQPPTVNGNQASVTSTHGLSKLVAYNLLPESTALSSEAVADKTSGGVPQETSDQPSRIVLTKSSASTEDQFLTVFAVMGDTSATPPVVERVESTDSAWIGVTSEEGGVRRVAMFSKFYPAPQTEISFTVTKGDTDQFTVFDLVPNATYSVTITEAGANETLTATPDGAGTFKVSPEGTLIFAR